MARQCTDFSVMRDWREEEKKGRKKDLSENSFVGSGVLDDMGTEGFYESEKFTIGYNELQYRWSSQLPAKTNTSCSSPSHYSIPSQTPHLSTPSHRNSIRRTLHLPLNSQPSSPSTMDSTQSTPSPDSPMFGTESKSGKESLPLIPKGFCRDEVSRREGREECQRPSRLLGVIRDVLQEALNHASLRPRKRRHHEHMTSNEQVAILENELEAYRVLSQAKKDAADLLKHELMAVLYEQVLEQEQQEHVRCQLETEINDLECQLYHLRATSHHHLSHLSSQLKRALREKQLLQRQLSPRLPHLLEETALGGKKTGDETKGRMYPRRRSC